MQPSSLFHSKCFYYQRERKKERKIERKKEREKATNKETNKHRKETQKGRRKEGRKERRKPTSVHNWYPLAFLPSLQSLETTDLIYS